MGLNIVAHRRVSLKGFAQGWDDCFIIVRAVNEQRRLEWVEKIGGKNDDATSTAALREACLEVIERGQIINTSEDGIQSPYEFKKDEVSEVVDALNVSWQSEIVSVATGADRLKATISSV